MPHGHLTTLTLHLHHETVKAILVSDTGDDNDAVWIPRSLCEIEPLKGQVVEVTLPETFAISKGLL